MSLLISATDPGFVSKHY